MTAHKEPMPYNNESVEHPLLEAKEGARKILRAFTAAKHELARARIIALAEEMVREMKKPPQRTEPGVEPRVSRILCPRCAQLTETVPCGHCGA